MTVSCLGARAALADLDHWLIDYYGAGPFCSTATVVDFNHTEGQVVVTLAVDPRWTLRLPDLPAGMMTRYFALHCPTRWELAEAQREHGLNSVVIEAELPGPELHRHLCR